MSREKKLSILVPSRNEEFLRNTISDILINLEDDTEIIVGLDGVWDNIVGDAKYPVSFYYSPTPLGNRGMTNQLCRLSKSKYVMKCDAHCAFDKGFDRKLMEDMQDDWTVVPMMYNLHAFDWVGKDRIYQGPKPEGDYRKEIVWKPRLDRCSWAWGFDKDLNFKLTDGCHNTPKEKDLVVTMSLLGACFMMTRDRWWKLNICDESYGSWAQQWTEVALKSWQTGKLICNRKTWFSHLYRLKEGEFGYPYPQNHNEENEKAKKLIRERFDIDAFFERFPLKEKLEGENWDFYR